MVSRGRPSAVNILEVRAIRQEYHRGACYRELVVRHGVSYGTVSRIVRGLHPLAAGGENLSRGPGTRREARNR